MFYNSCSCRRRGRIAHEVKVYVAGRKLELQDCLLVCSSQRTGVFRTRRRAKWPTPNRRKWIRFKLALTRGMIYIGSGVIEYDREPAHVV